MTSRELNLTLLNRFPDLAREYHDYISWQDGHDTGSHCVYGDVFANFLIDRINANDHKWIKEAFTYIEDLLQLHDEYVDNVMQLSVLEHIWSYVDTKDRNVYLEYLGTRTSEIFTIISTYL